MSDFILIAKIIAVSGDKGFLKIKSFSDFPERFLNLKNVYLDFFGEKKKLSVESVQINNNVYSLKFKNFNSSEDAAVLVGKEIFIEVSELAELPEDHYYVHDIIDSIVFRNGIEFGKVKDFLILPANNVYVIETGDGKEILVPAVSEFIEDFDSAKKILTLKPGTELYEEDKHDEN